MDAPIAAMVLPPKEGFGPGGTGAVGLLLRRLAGSVGFRSVVVGMDLGPRFDGVEFRVAGLSRLPGKGSWRYARGVLAALKRLQPAVVEVHNRPDIAVYLARRLPRVPVCLVLHNDPQGMRWLRTARQRGRVLRRLAAVAAVSGWVRGRMLEGVSGEVSVLANCLDLTEVPQSPAVRERVILFAGRVVADKGADAFVAACGKALPLLPGWRAEMIGADRFGPDSPETEFLRGLRPQAEATGVAMLGYRAHDQVLAAMARASVVVVPSRWQEPFGLTALEAMACGAALLFAPRGGLPEVVGEAGVPIEPEDPQGMAEAMVGLACDPARMAALGEAGRIRAAGFNVAHALRALDGLRTAVLAAWPKRGRAPI